MAFQHQVDSLRSAMVADLRRSLSEGRLTPGEKLPSIRALAQRYGTSVKVASQAVAVLVDEGLLHTLPRKGLFVGTQQAELKLFLLTIPAHSGYIDYLRQAQLGFEARIAQLGGASLLLLEHDARQKIAANELPPLAGMFRLEVAPEGGAWWPPEMPCVEFGEPGAHGTPSDRVQFEDLAGGRMAAGHLLARGHQRIAFLAMHSNDDQPAAFTWSRRREQGWLEVMSTAGREASTLVVHPPVAPELEGADTWPNHVQFAQAYLAARDQIVPLSGVSAVVTANVIAAQALVAALQQSGRAQNDWPAILCFDDLSGDTSSVVSYLHLPWDELGREAAQLLWERSVGRLLGAPTQRLAPMRLVQRLSSLAGQGRSWVPALLQDSAARAPEQAT